MLKKQRSRHVLVYFYRIDISDDFGSCFDISTKTRAAVSPGGVVIGNRAYPDDEITKAFEDAKAVAYELDRLGFKVSEEHDLGVEKMRCVLRDFKHKASGAAWALVYFSGHGMELKGENWLVPIDAELKRSADLQHQAVSLNAYWNAYPGRASCGL